MAEQNPILRGPNKFEPRTKAQPAPEAREKRDDIAEAARKKAEAQRRKK